MWKCKHCEEEFDFIKSGDKANHSRWCKSNPNRSVDFLKKARESIRRTGNQFTKAREEGRILESALKGTTYKGRPHTEESKNKMSKKALSSKHRRLRRNILMYNGIMLDSSWELEMAKRLDELNIKWERPGPLPYTVDGKVHNYFPDFYLPERGIYLDPKNTHAYNVQKNKIEILSKIYPITFLTRIEDIRSFI